NQGLNAFLSIAKPRGVRHILRQSKPADCAVRHCAVRCEVFVYGRTIRERVMTRKRSLYLSVAAICLAGCFIWSQPRAETTVPIKKTDIGGVVTSPNGPEAG